MDEPWLDKQHTWQGHWWQHGGERAGYSFPQVPTEAAVVIVYRAGAREGTPGSLVARHAPSVRGVVAAAADAT